MLPDPKLPEGSIEVKENARESFNTMLNLFREHKVKRMYGLFFNNAITCCLPQGILIIFYSLILRRETLTEQFRISSLIMMMGGIGGMCGGQIIGAINDRFGGSLNVSKANIVGHVLVYSIFIACNEIDNYNVLCYLSCFLIGASDSALVT